MCYSALSYRLQRYCYWLNLHELQCTVYLSNYQNSLDGLQVFELYNVFIGFGFFVNLRVESKKSAQRSNAA